MKKEIKDKIIDLKNDGKGYGEIGKLLGLNRGTVAKFIQRYCEREHISIGNVCPNCGKTFLGIPGPTKKRFCCDKCKHDWWNKHRLELRTIYKVKCAHCGKLFSTTDKKAKYCSRDCYFNERYKNEQ